MRVQIVVAAFVFSVAGLAGCAGSSETIGGDMDIPSNATPDRVSQAEMPAYCRGEAAAEFGERPQNIRTLPAERDQGMFTVYGQFPPDGEDATFFTCTFTADGEFVGVDLS